MLAIDPEKQPDSCIRGLMHHGIEIDSRYDKLHEYKIMTEIVSNIPEPARPYIKSIFCDSKACSVYEVQLRPCESHIQENIARYLVELIEDITGGHNGIYVNCGWTHILDADPWWPEDEEMM